MSEWRQATVGEVATRVTKGTTPTTVGGRFSESGISFVKVEAILDGRIDANKLAYIDEATHALLARSVLQASDVLFTIAGSIGRLALVSESLLPANANQAVAIIRPDATRIDPRFLCYALSDEARIRHAQARIVQSVQANFSLTELRSMPIPHPPLPEQRRIAKVLGALDDKIEHSRLLSDRCEALADTSLDQLLDSADRGRCPLGEIARPHKASIAPRDLPNDWFEHFSIPAFDAGRTPTVERGAAMLSAKTRLPSGDVVLVSKLNPATPRIWWPRPTGEHSAVCSPEFIALVPQDGCPASFLYASFRRDRMFYDEILSHATGTTGSRQRVKPTEVMASHVLDARERWEGFDEVARPLYDKAAATIAESRRLATIRDLLLPKLISGEIRVPDSYDPDDALGTVAQAAGNAA